VQPERPAALDQVAHHGLQLALERRREIGPRLEEVLEVRRREDQHLARAVHPVEVIALARAHDPGPRPEIIELLPGPLREEVVGDAQRELTLRVQLLDDPVVVRVVLEPAAGVDHAGQPEPVELAHEVARRVDLVLVRELWSSRQHRVEDERAGLCEEQTGRVALLVALDRAARRIWRVPGVADGAQRGAVQHRQPVEI
jgi:hypothetical protein